MDDAIKFIEREQAIDIENGTQFSPKFDENGLIPCMAIEAKSGDPLMFAFMNKLALEKTILTKEVHYWSRSRQELWHKGATSGSIQKVIEINTDCDQDCILVKVEVENRKHTCHLGHETCFFRKLDLDGSQSEGTSLIYKET